MLKESFGLIAETICLDLKNLAAANVTFDSW